MLDRWQHLKDHRSKAALREIRDDIENVRAAWRYWLEQRKASQLRKFFESLWMTHETWGWFRPAIDLFREAAALLQGDDDPELASVHAYALAEEGWFLSLVGSPDKGIVLARQSSDVLCGLGEDMFLPASSVNINAIFLDRLDEVTASVHNMQQSARTMGDPWDQGFVLIWQAYIEIL